MFEILDVLLSGVQIICFVLSIIYYKFYKQSTEKYFIFFLGYVIISEALGYLLAYNLNVSNQIVYNIFTLVSIQFYIFWFSLILKKQKIKIVFSLIFMISVVVQLLYNPSTNKLWKIPLTLGTILVVILSTIFFINLLKSNKVISYNKNLKFWFVTGLLIFYVGFLPIQLMQEYINGQSIDYYAIITILNILMYGTFSIGFLRVSK